MRRQMIWALVMNSEHAHILRGLDRADTDEPIELTNQANATRQRDAQSEERGRSHASDHSGRRSAMEPGADTVLRDMQDFAQEAFRLLEEHRSAGDFDRLAIFASPKMLGVLRKALPPSLGEAVMQEEAANLVGMPVHDLRTFIRNKLESGAVR
ncbi:host attachment protein [Breoghania sp.]|uniref:host attachment protein n=1 Tax=Breoghania sp. TaxID=2065378 RepID=UPI002AAB7982|nr:host attachment protein [Breoghania sp.]